ncbi:MAG: hypothetical protein JSS32_05450 [Verrucomicrobia bacterium]|nr:hypothetical protein [Verrucomicrobiota bacterium]
MRYIQLDEKTEAALREICNKSLEFQGNAPLNEWVNRTLSQIKEGNPSEQ